MQRVQTVKAEIIVEGQPVGKGRPKFARQGNFVKAYTPEKTAEYEELVRTVWQLKAKDSQYRTVYFPAGTSVCIGIKACYPIPKNTDRVKREKMLSGEIRPLVKPDLDNIGKIVCDALNGIAYADDKQIAEMWIQEWYSENPRVEITVMDSGSENVR